MDPEQDAAAHKILFAVMSAVSKAFNALMKSATKGEDKNAKCAPDSIAAYCCKQGYLSLLTYVLDNGAPLTKQARAEARAHGHLDCLKLIEERGCISYDQQELDSYLWLAIRYSSRAMALHFLNKGAERIRASEGRLQCTA